MAGKIVGGRWAGVVSQVEVKCGCQVLDAGRQAGWVASRRPQVAGLKSFQMGCRMLEKKIDRQVQVCRPRQDAEADQMEVETKESGPRDLKTMLLLVCCSQPAPATAQSGAGETGQVRGVRAGRDGAASDEDFFASQATRVTTVAVSVGWQDGTTARDLGTDSTMPSTTRYLLA